MVSKPEDVTRNAEILKCPWCGGSKNVSLGFSYESTAVYKRKRCKECGMLYKAFHKNYERKEVVKNASV